METIITTKPAAAGNIDQTADILLRTKIKLSS